MKAVIFSQYGSADDLRLGEVAQPVPGDREVLVRIHTASVNSWDWELMRGTPFANRATFGLFRPKKINILGCDIAGRIEAVGKEVTKFQLGDDVFGDLSSGGWGGFAEYLCANENELTLKPAGMTFAQAASIPQAALLALQGLRKGKLQAGQKLLINGAGGGMGTFAVQIAKAWGAEVTGVDSGDKLDMLRALGADHVIDYTQEDFTRSGQHYDLILDAQARHPLLDYRRALNPGGAFIIVGGLMGLIFRVMLFGPLLSWIGNKKMAVLIHKANLGLEEIKALFEAGQLVPVIGSLYSLSEVPAAIRKLENKKIKGKAVIAVMPDS